MSLSHVTGFTCAGCGATVPATAHPYACPNRGAGDDVDHVLVRRSMTPPPEWPSDSHPNPFVRWRRFLYAYDVARNAGIADGEFKQLVIELDRAVQQSDGRSFKVTPFAPSPRLSEALGGAEVWVKDETQNVAGSHKARHLMGVAIHLEVMGQLGRDDGSLPLAIASCGNAALAASVVAAAAERALNVFIPTDANPKVVAQLEEHGAYVNVCHRQAGVDGDPCYLDFRAAVGDGAMLPFCCQGPDCGLTVEGGQTLAWEMASELGWRKVALDDVYAQVGGGAFASALIRGFEQAVEGGVLAGLPRFHAVQTDGCYPVVRAWEKVVAKAFEHLGAPVPDAWPERARALKGAPEAVAAALTYARQHRSEFMRPWETPPHSLAHGILDDETYDWAAIVAGMLKTGGWPVLVTDPDLTRAVQLAKKQAKVIADATGASGLAGALVDRAAHPDAWDASRPPRLAVILSGVER
ncbi:MAG: hypothetical protein CVU56_20925 [Deltaproteobacteria bacterium HGW-Deltaproteobacteria-14]|nr:MAG: hypothetical protein CVU56_20925 [Deltaproteobacteria bacterium HGW-Deltaproteobacteria-14]